MDIRKAELQDFDFFYKIKSEDDNIFWCGHDAKPDRNNLKVFWSKYVPYNVSREIYIIREMDSSVGYIYIDFIDSDEIEVSIGVSSEYSGRGIGTKALKLITTNLQEDYKSIFAYIREDNIRSEKIFTKANFIKTDAEKRILHTKKTDVMILNKWVYKNERQNTANIQ